MPKRVSGVLLHPSSLPGPYGIGDLGRSAISFLDWLEEADQTVWQVLPLGPVGQGNSPYDAQSSYAGNPALIDLEGLCEWGLLDWRTVEAATVPDATWVDFDQVTRSKSLLLRAAWQNLRTQQSSQSLLEQFSEWAGSPAQTDWLESWAFFAALKDRFVGRGWTSWPTPLKRWQTASTDETRQELAEEIQFHQFVQFTFFRQWDRLRSAAADRGISLLGDLPFYVAMDSCDVWTHPELFDLDAAGNARTVGGVPPDYFSATGQRWGNPTYRWNRHADEGFRWWIDRLRFQTMLVDRLRLDHFRGFAAYWEIPADQDTAVDGRWRPGPGRSFFAAVNEALGGLPFVAEDLGVITPDVEQLRLEFGLPGMKVLQFAFDSDDSPHLPHHLTPDTVLYTGTHDNNTAQGWFQELGSDLQNRVLDYTGGSTDKVHWALIRTALTSVADGVIILAQDLAGLDATHRMNTPGTAQGNWGWRLLGETLSQEMAASLQRLTAVAGRSAADDV